MAPPGRFRTRRPLACSFPADGVGRRVVIRKATLRAIQSMAQQLGIRVSKQVIAKSAARVPVADIVINHRNGTKAWAGFQNPTWGTSSPTYQTPDEVNVPDESARR